MKKISKSLMCGVLSLSTALLPSAQVWAQAGLPDASVRELLDQSSMVDSSIAKIYRARVLLEDYKNWQESYELLRDVIKNDKNLNPVVERKLKNAARQISGYLPGKFLRKTFNARHLLRPFLEASFLINEALMDSRVALNSSSDSEVPFVESLLKSYFFPGAEQYGIIEFPNPSTYAFDLFALTEDNINKARRDDSYSQATAKTAPIAAPAARSVQAAAQVATPSPVKDPLASLGMGTQYSVVNGFLDKVLEAGLEVSDITDEVKTLIEKFSVTKRVNNRYIELSMLMQAVTDPGSALFDPQLQAFLSGVRLKLALGVVESVKPEDRDALRDILGSNAVVQSKDGTRILLTNLIDEQSKNPLQRSALELQINQVQGTSRNVLYAISSVAGPDLVRLQTLHMASVMAREMDQINKVLHSPVIIKGAKLVGVSWKYLLKVLPKAAHLVASSSMAHSNNAKIAVTVNGIARFLGVAGYVQNVAAAKLESLGPKTAGLLRAIRDNKHVKNGTVTGVLTFAAAAAQLTIGGIEYAHAEDEDVKRDIYVETLSRTGATLFYALPYVGWGAAVLDASHIFFGVPLETADLFRGVNRGAENVTYWALGTHRTYVEYQSLENKLDIPRAQFYFKMKSHCDDTLQSCEIALVTLREEMRDVAFSQLVLLYAAHRTFASKTNYRFGERIEDYIRSYQDNRKEMRLKEQDLMVKVRGLMANSDVQ